jgi:hypothetical protein
MPTGLDGRMVFYFKSKSLKKRDCTGLPDARSGRCAMAVENLVENGNLNACRTGIQLLLPLHFLHGIFINERNFFK